MILPLDSGVWRQRFLSIYDYPIIEDFTEFSIAYRLRHIALRRLKKFDFSKPGRKELEVLGTVKDLILGRSLIQVVTMHASAPVPFLLVSIFPVSPLELFSYYMTMAT